jgi:integrase
MRWTEVNLDERTWFLDGLRTKNDRPHLIALPTAAFAIVERRREAVAKTDPRVFPSLTVEDEKPTGSRAFGTRTIAEIAQSFPDFDWRDLRRTFATRLAELGIGEDTIGRLLNHARYGVTGKHYNHYKYLTEKRTALETWDRELTRILKNEPKTSKVVPIR